MNDEARDARFSNLDPRLLRIAESLGLDLSALDGGTLPEALADAVEAQGIADSADARSLFADLLRSDADRRAAHTGPRPLTQVEALKRARLAALAHSLSQLTARSNALPGYMRPRAKTVQGLSSVFREIASHEGAAWLSVKRWCMVDPDAREMIRTLRPVRAQDRASKPLRGHGAGAPLGDQGKALQDAFKL